MGLGREVLHRVQMRSLKAARYILNLCAQMLSMNLRPGLTGQSMEAELWILLALVVSVCRHHF